MGKLSYIWRSDKEGEKREKKGMAANAGGGWGGRSFM